MAERADRIALRTDFSLLIDGKLEQSAQYLDVINPALGTVFARCPAAQRTELDRAVAAARRAFQSQGHTDAPAHRSEATSPRPTIHSAKE